LDSASKTATLAAVTRRVHRHRPSANM
jgi:hypothetical protein